MSTSHAPARFDTGRDTTPSRQPLRSRRTFGGVRVYSAACLTLGAAIIHLAVAPAHFREWLPFGLFFLGIGSAQIVLAFELLNRPTRRLALLLALASLGLVGLWFWSRSVGLPVGPTPGVPEDVGLTDIVCNVMELLSSIVLLSLTAWPARSCVRRMWLVGLGVLPMALLSVAMTAAALAASMSAMPEAVNAAPAVAGTVSASITTLVEPPGNQPLKTFTLDATETTINGHDVYAYNGVVPGPELRVTQGDRVRVTLVNHLPESTTLHWHGLRVPDAVDGVAGLTQDAVQPRDSFTYEFVVNEAGTFWYHSHQQTEAQLPRGLFGAIVVEPRGGRVPQQHDYTVMLHGTEGQVSLNGEPNELHLDAQPGETVRLRLINAVVAGMDGGPEAPLLVGAPFQVVSLDGRDLNAPGQLESNRIPLGMGQRADLVFRMPASGGVRLIDTEVSGQTTPVQAVFARLAGGDNGPRLASAAIGTGAPPAVPASTPLFDPLVYGVADSDPVASATPDVTAPVMLGEHPALRDGRPELVHTINDQAAPDVPPIEVAEGQIVRLHIVNSTAEYHPMHLHGHVMSVISRNGVAPEGSPIHLDSIMVGPNQTWDVQFAADNPGIWMFHCHVLLHAGMGMMSTINYTGYSTPFEMGTRSGNMPE